MENEILEMMVAGMKQKLIFSDMLELQKIARAVNLATKAHYEGKIPSDERIMELAHEFMAEDNELLNINNNFSVEELQASAEFITDFGIWLKSQLTKQP